MPCENCVVRDGLTLLYVGISPGRDVSTQNLDILSPFAADRSAVADAVKLTRDASPGRAAILIYGFDAPARPVAANAGLQAEDSAHARG